MTVPHSMWLVDSSADRQRWECPCGRAVDVYPELIGQYNELVIHVVREGDTNAQHTGSTGGVRIGGMSVEAAEEPGAGA